MYGRGEGGQSMSGWQVEAEIGDVVISAIGDKIIMIVALLFCVCGVARACLLLLLFYDVLCVVGCFLG